MKTDSYCRERNDLSLQLLTDPHLQEIRHFLTLFRCSFANFKVWRSFRLAWAVEGLGGGVEGCSSHTGNEIFG